MMKTRAPTNVFHLLHAGTDLAHLLYCLVHGYGPATQAPPRRSSPPPHLDPNCALPPLDKKQTATSPPGLPPLRLPMPLLALLRLHCFLRLLQITYFTCLCDEALSFVCEFVTCTFFPLHFWPTFYSMCCNFWNMTSFVLGNILIFCLALPFLLWFAFFFARVFFPVFVVLWFLVPVVFVIFSHTGLFLSH